MRIPPLSPRAAALVAMTLASAAGGAAYDRTTPGDRSAAAGLAQPSSTALVRLRTVDAGADADEVPGWGGDNGYDTGNTSWFDAPSATGVTGAAPPGVYRTNRWGGSFAYTVRDLRPGATYVLRLHFVEDYWDTAGRRVFDVTANGAKVVSGLDLVAVAGPRKAVVRQVPVTADAAGRVELSLTATKGDATLSGFEILRTGTAGAPAMPAAARGSALTSTRALVEWKPDVEASRYTVFRNGRRIGTTKGSAFIDRYARPGSTYRYSVRATGPTFRLSAPTKNVVVTMPPTGAPSGGRFVTRDSTIVDPQGRRFVPVGANLGSPSTATGAGVADGHAVQAEAWGWNAVRLTFYTTDEYSWTYRSQHGYQALLDEVRSLVTEYRRAGLVVVVDGHDDPRYAPDEARTLDQMATFWKDAATMFKGDSGVWFNLINEPGYMNDDWFDISNRFLASIRGTGAQNIVVVDAPTWGQDLGGVKPFFPGTRYGYDPVMAPKLASRYGNVVLSQHNYGAYDKYTTAARYGAYADRVRDAGLPLVTGETGYTTDGSTTAGGYTINRNAALATFASNPAKGVGTFVWNGTHNDRYSLKADNSAFYTGATVGDGLSDMGQRLWALSN